ncbi:MAG: cation:proton antiporter, partial [Thermoplasmatota archaeon]
DKVLALGDRIRLPQALLSISLAILFIYAYFADNAGITGIIGGFVAGLLIGNTAIGSRKIKQDVRIIGESFFIPLFFIWVGASVDLAAFTSIGYFALAIVIISIAGKMIGCGLGAKIAGLNSKDSLLVGIGMIPRLEMAIVTVTIAISHGIIESKVLSDKLLATTILVSIISAIITPPLIKIVSSRNNN